MGASHDVAEVRPAWVRFAQEVERPARCRVCAHPRVHGNGHAERTATVQGGEQAVHVTGIRCRRVRCAACRKSWPLQPAGLVPRRHYQLCVVAEAASQHLFAGDVQERVAEGRGCSRRSVGRWLRWIGECADPAALGAELLAAVGAPVLPRLRALAPRLRALRDGARRALLERAAAVLELLEALALAWGLEPPGLRGVVEHVLRRGRDAIPPYRAPLFPELARSHPRRE
jgi:hypothetical protein